MIIYHGLIGVEVLEFGNSIPDLLRGRYLHIVHGLRKAVIARIVKLWVVLKGRRMRIRWKRDSKFTRSPDVNEIHHLRSLVHGGIFLLLLCAPEVGEKMKDFYR